MTSDLSRRRLLFGGAALSAGVLLAGCTSNEQTPTEAQTRAAATGANSEPGKKVTIGFSAPAADHGWIAAITNNAKAQAGAYSDVELKSVEAGADAAAQRAALSTLISQKPDVIVLLPHDGKELNAFGLEAMKAGIPVVNLDRAFPDARAYRLQIKGDNYGMGVAAATYIAAQLKAKGVSNPVIGEIPGIDSLELTQERSKGFADTLASLGLKVANRRPASRPPPASSRRCRRSTRSGTTTTTRASASWPRSTRPTARSSSWSAAPGRRRPWRTSRPTTPC
jgi:ribose transport system substrate-binding protein